MSKPTSDCRATERKHPWPMVRLGEVCEFVYGYPFDSGKFNTTGEGLALIRIRDVVPGVSCTFTTEAVPPKYFVKDGDLLVGMDGDFNLSRWKGGKALLNQRVCMFKPNEKLILAGYIEFGLGQYLSDIWENKSFSTVKHLSAKDLNAITFPLPPLSVQREIVARLERELAAVEKLKKGFEGLAETAKAEFKAELKAVFEGLGGKMDGQARPSGKGHLGWRKLGEIAKISYGFTAKASPDVGDGSPKYLRITDIQGRSVEWGSVPVCSCSDLETYRLKEGDIVFARTGATTGKSFLITGDIPLSVYASYLIRVQIVNFKTINPWFLWYSFDTPDYWASIQSGMVGAAQGGFNSKKLAGIEIPLPPLAEQREVVARLDVAKDRAEKLEAKAREGVAVCEAMRKAILKEAFE